MLMLETLHKDAVLDQSLSQMNPATCHADTQYITYGWDFYMWIIGLRAAQYQTWTTDFILKWHKQIVHLFMSRKPTFHCFII